MPSLLTQCTDTLLLIIPHCGSIQALSTLSQTNKWLHSLLMESTNGKRIWLEMVSRVTGHNAKDHIDVNCPDFHERVKLLACPWLVIPRHLTINVQSLMDPENMRISMVKEEFIALWHKDEGSEDDRDFKVVSIADARPCDCNQPRLFTDRTEDLKCPGMPPRKTFQPIMQPIQLQILTNQHDCRYYFQYIHEGAFAVIEVAAWDMEQRNGIYFFDQRQGKATRMLRHILIGECPAPTTMIIRPMEMWMLTEESVIYFGPSCDGLPLSISGRMDWPLWLAGNGKIKKAMQVLKHLGVSDINTPSVTGKMTLLHIATLHDQGGAVRSLLKAKANPELRDDQGMSCVMIASSMENPYMIRLMCSEGKADPNASSYFNETALHVVGHQSTSKRSRAKATIEALLEYKADPNAEDTKGQTPLFSYTVLESPSTVNLLCSRGANPRHKNHQGMTPLHILFEVSNERQSAITLVRKFGADVDARNNQGITPLMLAAHTRTYVNVRTLLDDLKANPLLRDCRGHDALWFAKTGTDTPTQARAVVRLIETKCAEWIKSRA